MALNRATGSLYSGERRGPVQYGEPRMVCGGSTPWDVDRIRKNSLEIGSLINVVPPAGVPRRAARNARGLRRFAPQPATGHWPVATLRFDSRHVAFAGTKKATRRWLKHSWCPQRESRVALRATLVGFVALLLSPQQATGLLRPSGSTPWDVDLTKKPSGDREPC